VPELPEVETVRGGLQRLLPGLVVAAVDYDWDKSFPNAPVDVRAFLVGSKIQEVRRRAKVLLIDLSSGYTLVVHLKMTGQLVYIKEGHTPPLSSEMNSELSLHPLKFPRSARAADISEVRFGAGHPNDSLVGELPDKSTRVTLAFTDGSRLFFNDQRKFGWMRLMPTAEVPNIDFMKRVGPEPLEADFTWQVLSTRLARRLKTSIKAALLDQSVVAGIGNIYADECLWGSKIHPASMVGNLSDKDVKTLHSQLQAVLRLSIEKGGSSNRNYVNAEGKKGSYMEFANVFRHEGQPCPRCGTTIIKLKVAGRGTHICPKEQKLGKIGS
jgi:formamidopyrimidine-DNA glycosylase